MLTDVITIRLSYSFSSDHPVSLPMGLDVFNLKSVALLFGFVDGSFY